ncbi:MAG: hypothetical protein QGG69_02625 [Kiritimatiellia bacterium]|jgi:hypothetical protein|nr:hypothetical protein [Kiritimatiellia bacterium]MDP6631439.1 hypothetical protein [Kiritimatiellia bacterium]MDP6811455.1 hypothetical protein [Kiritimatiellia bacterium]
MKRFSYILMGCALLLMCSVMPVVHANVILGEEHWDSGLGSPEWTENESYVSLVDDSSGYLEINYTGSRGPGQAETTVYMEDPEVFFTGNWGDTAENNHTWIEFDFWADDNAPLDFELRFEGTSGDVWRYDLSTASLGSGFVNFSAALTYSDWYYGEFGGSDVETFLSDLNAIDWIGIYIFDDDTAANEYRLDDFQLMVPEPAEYALAFSALAVTLLSVRRKRKKGAVQAA